jgi:adenosylhomocysteine nucleosidase
LMKLGRHSAAAAKGLAEALYDWLDESGSVRRSNGDYTEKKR